MTCSTCANRGCPSCTTPPPPGQTYSSCTVALCQRHHDACTSPVGEMRKLCELVGLIVRSKK